MHAEDMDPILFSIIIPTHNRPELLRKAIKSVINQVYPHWELIVVDDGSIPKSASVVDAFGDDRIRYVYKDHGERSMARNMGIDLAIGEYICFLDDDDIFLDQHLSTLHEEIVNRGRDVAVYRTGMLIDYGHKKEKSEFYNTANHGHPARFFIKNMAGIHTLCYNRKILNEIRFDERWIHFQDTHLLVRTLLAYPFYQIDKRTAVYNCHSNMGSYRRYMDSNAYARIQNNIDAMLDLFNQTGKQLLAFFSEIEQQQMINLKYLHTSIAASRFGNNKLSKILLNKVNIKYLVGAKNKTKYIFMKLKVSL